MRSRRILAPVLLSSLLAASALAGSSEPQRFGAAVTMKKSAKVAQVAKSPARFEGKTLKLEGTVRNVCQGAGCWVEIEDAKGVTFLAKSLDESVLLPKDCKGQNIVVQGVVTSKASKGHEGHAHAAGSVEEGHSCPAPEFLLSMLGVELKPAKAAR